MIEKEVKIMESDPKNYIANPLNAFILIKTLSYDIEKIESRLAENANKFIRDVSNIKLSLSDFDGAIDGFYRLHETYELKTKEVVDGIIDGVKVREKLTERQIYTLGREIANRSLDIGIEYLEIVRDKSDGDLKYEVSERLLSLYQKNQKFAKALNILNDMMVMQPNNETLKCILTNFTITEDIPEPDIQKDLEGTHHTIIKEKKMFHQACMFKRNKSPSESSKLFCKYLVTTPFTKIAPLKLEIANHLPFIGIFHDIISDREVDVLIDISIDHLVRAQVFSSNGSISIPARVAKLTWMRDYENEIVARISRRVGDMSGMNMNFSEALQMQNYGIGGYYNLHYDYSPKGRDFNLGIGNRIATALFYVRS